MKTVKLLELKSKRVRVAEPSSPYGTPIKEPSMAAELAERLLDGDERESFLVFLLDIRNKVIGYVEAAKGGIDNCPVDLRMVFREAVHVGASAVIVAHNHPSGDTTPSSEDIALTRRLEKAGELLGIPVLDHVVVGDGYYSFAEHSRMKAAA